MTPTELLPSALAQAVAPQKSTNYYYNQFEIIDDNNVQFEQTRYQIDTTLAYVKQLPISNKTAA